MTGFEPQTSGVGSDHTATTALFMVHPRHHFFHLCSIQSLVLALSFPKFEGTTLTKDKFTLLQKFCFHKGIEQSPTLEGEVLLYG